MRAVEFQEYGDPEVLQLVTVETPSPGQARSPSTLPTWA